MIQVIFILKHDKKKSAILPQMGELQVFGTENKCCKQAEIRYNEK